MAWRYRPNWRTARWVSVLGSPVLSIIAFFLAHWLDLLGFSTQPLSAIPAFLLSIVVLVVGQTITNTLELQNASSYTDRIYDAIKDYLHVTPIGSPEQAFRYINSRMPVLREVQNTSFNTDEESERASEKLYETDIYEISCRDIPTYCCKGLIWKDIGDHHALERMRYLKKNSDSVSKNSKGGYRFKVTNQTYPQINFIILEYCDGDREVLFNWDFRGNGQDPTVLISRDLRIVEMFAIQFTLLWRQGSEDHDSHATKSTSVK